jgi:hypothetical protein
MLDRFSGAEHQRARKIHPNRINVRDLRAGTGRIQIGYEPPRRIHERGAESLEDVHGQEGHAQPGKDK